MKNSMWRIATVVMLVGVSTFAMARTVPCYGLVSYLQTERNEIAVLTAQMQCLQQQGDQLGAAVVASYIPDHQMQANQLATLIRARGGNPDAVVANQSPYLGTRAQMLAFDAQQYQSVVQQYNQLNQQAINGNDPEVRQLATLGINGASRHFSSIQVGLASTPNTSVPTVNGLMSALALEQSTITDLQTQAARLQALGNPNDANILLSAVPAHQQQVAMLQSAITQMGGNPSIVTAYPIVPFATRDMILAHARVVDTQLINTYALPIAALPDSAMRNAFWQAQQAPLTQLAQLGGAAPVTASGAGVVSTGMTTVGSVPYNTTSSTNATMGTSSGMAAGTSVGGMTPSTSY